VPWPEPHMWLIFAGVYVIHVCYKCLQAFAYSKGAYTVVYPVVRGTGPLFAVIGAYFIFGETFTPGQWFGVALLLGGIYGLAAYNLKTITTNRDTLVPALFLAWFFFIDGLFFMPPLAAYLWAKNPDRPALGPLMARGVRGSTRWGRRRCCARHLWSLRRSSDGLS